jgi:hypothetical protein
LIFKRDNSYTKIHPSLEVMEAGKTIRDNLVVSNISGNNISVLVVVSSSRNIPVKEQRGSVFITLLMLKLGARWGGGLSTSGKYELRPAVKKFYQLRPKGSALSVPFASRVVNPKHDELRPAFSKELHQLHRKMWVYKMSYNWKVLAKFCCTLYTIICKHRVLLDDIDNTFVILCHCLIFKPY